MDFLGKILSADDLINKKYVDEAIPTTLPASDVYAWAKAATKPPYTKAEVGLGNVENKSSATIRGEITSANVTNALGYTPLSTAGGTISGTSAIPLYINASAVSNLVRFLYNNSEIADVGYYAGRGAILRNIKGGNDNYIAISDAGVPNFNGNTLIHSGNIGSQKVAGLATPVTIWGQSFDGTGNVSGSFYINNESPIHICDSAGTGRNALYLSSGNNLWIGYGTSAAQYNTIIAGYNTFFRYGGNSNTAISINSLGNVTVGTTTDSGYKFDVNGTARISGAVTMSSTLSVDGEVTIQNTYIRGTSTNPYIRFTLNGGNWYCQAYTTNGVDGIFLGSISTKSLKVDVNGNVYCPLNLIVAGDTSSGSDIRFKDKLSDHRIALSDIADAPLFTFRWNDREDDSVHLGSSAQYWEKVAPWLVKGEDFKTLDYSTLGVAIGISLANKTLNLEDRVKILEEENKFLKEQIRRINHGS